MATAIISRLVVVVVTEAVCQRCGTTLGRNVVVLEDQPAPELPCRGCGRIVRVQADGTGVPIQGAHWRRSGPRDLRDWTESR
jgi:hypothetical protein